MTISNLRYFRQSAYGQWPVLRCMLVLATLLTFGACDNGIGSATGVPLAAKVDGVGISQNAVMQLSPTNNQELRQAQLDNAIDEQLLANASVHDMRENSLPVAAEEENARRQALARDYLKRKSEALPTPSGGDIDAFYAENTALFAQRRSYRLQQIVVTVPQERVASIQTSVASMKTFGERADYLKKANIPFTTDAVVRAAEDLPSDMLLILAQLKDGDAFDTPTATGIVFTQIIGLQNLPVTLAQAHATISRYLTNQSLSVLMQAETKRLRDAAKIEVFAPYALHKL